VPSSAPSYGYIDPNFPPPRGPDDTPIIIYGYTPSFALAVFAAAWFFVLLLIHAFQLFKYRAWYFTPFSVGLIFEVAGYIARSLSARKNPYNLIYFVLNYFFIVTAPVFLAAGVYTILSGLITRVSTGGGKAPRGKAPKAIIWFFVVSDVVSTIVQVAGAALIGVSYSRRQDPTTANNILLGGLAYQVFSIGVFVILTAIFLAKSETRAALRQGGNKLGLFVGTFVVATLMIYLRTCFRLAETAEGLGSKLQTNEVYFACLEFAPIALAVVLLAIGHPGRVIGRKILGVPGDFESKPSFKA
jgi:hypothetical protein